MAKMLLELNRHCHDGDYEEYEETIAALFDAWLEREAGDDTELRHTLDNAVNAAIKEEAKNGHGQ